MTEHEANPAANQPRNEPTRHNGRAERARDFEQRLLTLKLAPPKERSALLAELAGLTELSAGQRRQLLLAVQRYIIGNPRSDQPEDYGIVLSAVLTLANRLSLRIKALEIFRHALEQMRREQVLSQLKEPLEQLLKLINPRSVNTPFGPELFLRVARRLEQDNAVDAVLNLSSLGLFFFPFNRTLREIRADYFTLQGNLSGARNDYAALLDEFPGNLDYLLDRAEVLIRMGEYEEAHEDLIEILSKQPEHIDALRRKAECLFQTGRNLEALALYTTLIEKEPKVVSHLILRARVNEQLDLLEDAIRDAELALEQDKSSHEARQLKQSLIYRRQSFGMEDDLYSAFARGEEEIFLGELKVPETSFADVAGLTKVKELIRETIEYPLKYPEISEKYGKKAGGGLLFFGPPGCGKTLLARAAAGQTGVTFINVNLASVLDKWVGNSEKAISMIFASARKRSPSMIFLDEVDSIGGSRANLQAGWERKLISQLLIELDGITSQNENVLVLGASNAPWEVDFALRRPGRMGRLVFVPPPDSMGRQAVFKLYLTRREMVGDDIDLKALAAKTENYSADAIRQIVENAASIPWRKAIESGETKEICQADLLLAIQQTPPDLAEWEKLVSRYKEFAEQSNRPASIGFRKQQDTGQSQT